MPILTQLTREDYRAMPWKNGRGVTLELACSPQGSDLSDFDWRISMAKVEEDGPFSSFPGIDRCLVVLDGAGIELDHGAGPVKLDPFVPHLFRGDDSTTGRLIDGPIEDFNVMTRRGKASCLLSTLHGTGAPVTLELSPGSTLIYNARGNLQIFWEGMRYMALLSPGDSLLVEGADAGAKGPLVLAGDGEQVALLVELHLG
jgi:environmental stress-induced protein Ves